MKTNPKESGLDSELYVESNFNSPKPYKKMQRKIFLRDKPKRLDRTLEEITEMQFLKGKAKD